MEVNEILQIQLEEFSNLNNQDMKRISLIVSDFKERIYYEYKALGINTSTLRELVDEFLGRNIEKILQETSNNYNENLISILKQTKEIIEFSTQV